MEGSDLSAASPLPSLTPSPPAIQPALRTYVEPAGRSIGLFRTPPPLAGQKHPLTPSPPSILPLVPLPTSPPQQSVLRSALRSWPLTGETGCDSVARPLANEMAGSPKRILMRPRPSPLPPLLSNPPSLLPEFSLRGSPRPLLALATLTSDTPPSVSHGYNHVRRLGVGRGTRTHSFSRPLATRDLLRGSLHLPSPSTPVPPPLYALDVMSPWRLAPA